MRLRCYECTKSVSNEVPDDTVVRAVHICPECIERNEQHEPVRFTYILRKIQHLSSHRVEAGLSPMSLEDAGKLMAEELSSWDEAKTEQMMRNLQGPFPEPCPHSVVEGIDPQKCMMCGDEL